ncbi:hypothetical protein D9M68_462820 [compost metagenome]
MEVHKDGRTGLTGLEIVHAERPRGIGGDRLLDRLFLFPRNRPVHQSIDRTRDHHPALEEDVAGDDDGEQGVEDRVAGRDGKHEADENADRGDDIRQDMVTIGTQRRRAMVAAGCDQHIGPDGVDDSRGEVDRQAQSRRFHHHRRHDRRHRFPDDQKSCNDNQHAFDDG